MIKKINSAMAVLFLSIVLLGGTAFAKTNTQGQVDTLEQLKDKYNLEVVTDVPQGIIPKEFNSIEDADKYFSQTILDTNSISNSSKISTEITSDSGNSISSSNDITVKTVTKSAGYLNGSVYLNITCTYASKGLVIPQIYSVSSSIAGNTTNWGWAQSSYSSTSIDSGRTRVLTVYGTLTQYVYVNGTTVKYSSSKSGSIEIYK